MRGRDRRDRAAAAVLVAMVVVPVLVAGWSTLDRSWLPMGDDAVTMLRASDVGTEATPLVGSYSTRGWSHPGPIGFYLLAAASPLGSSSAPLAATASLHAAAIVGIGVAAWQRRGLLLVGVAMTSVALLVHGIAADILIWPWNPYLGMLPAALLALAAWSVACGDHRWLLPAVVIGSVVVQLHVSHVLPVLAAAAATAWCLHADRRGWPTRRQLLVSGAALVVVWAPVAVDTVAGTGNVQRIGRYFASGDGTAIGTARGLEIVGRYLAPAGVWSGADEIVAFGSVEGGSPLTPLVLLVVLAALLVACRRRGRRDAAALVLIALCQLAVACVAAGRLEDPLFPYVMAWLLPLAMVVWLAIAWAVLDLVTAWWTTSRPESAHGRHAAELAAIGVMAAVIVLALGRTGPTTRWTSPRLPRADHAAAVRATTAQLDHALARGARLHVEVVGDPIGESGVAIIATLIGDGHDVYTSDGAPSRKWGEHRRWDGQAVDATLTIVVGPGHEDPALLDACRASPAIDEVATFDALAPAERAERAELRFIRFTDQAALTDQDLARLEDLDERAYRIAVFSGPDLCA